MNHRYHVSVRFNEPSESALTAFDEADHSGAIRTLVGESFLVYHGVVAFENPLVIELESVSVKGAHRGAEKLFGHFFPEGGWQVAGVRPA